MDAPLTEKMNVVFVGHVDHGKSTVIGRLLADTNALPTGKLEQIKAYCERNSLPFEYAFLIDALKDERRQNITIDSARVFFNSARRRYIIIDAPGHIEFVKNMVTGAARAEAALLVIDAQEGVQENSRRHGNLLSLLGIRQMVVLVNKMDLVAYDQKRYESIRDEYTAFLKKIGLEPKGFIPVSARMGDSISQPGEHMPWYTGPTVLEQLDAFEKAQPPTDQPFRMPVQDVYRFTMFGDNRRIVAGTPTSGTARPGDELIFYPSGKRSIIRSIEGYGKNGNPERIQARQAAGITLSEQIYVRRGEIAARFGEPAPLVTRRLRTSIFWLGQAPLSMKKTYMIKLGTEKVRFQVEEILRVIDASSLEGESGYLEVPRHAMAECILALDQPLAFDRADFLAETSRFVVVDGYEIRGGGIVLEDLPDSQAGDRARVFSRNAHWIRGDVNMEERAERYNQRACLVLITGPQHVGRKRLARALEARLFREGKTAYYLGMGSLVYGVGADISEHPTPESRQEHVRRMAEIANLFLDAGLILLVTAVELTQKEVQMIQTAVGPGLVETVWVGEQIASDLRPDLRLERVEDPEQAVLQIKQLLQAHGVILKV